MDYKYMFLSPASSWVCCGPACACINNRYTGHFWEFWHALFCFSVSTAIATTPKSSKSRNSHFSLSRRTNSNCTEEFESLYLVDCTGVIFLVESIVSADQKVQESTFTRVSCILIVDNQFNRWLKKTLRNLHPLFGGLACASQKLQVEILTTQSTRMK